MRPRIPRAQWENARPNAQRKWALIHGASRALAIAGCVGSVRMLAAQTPSGTPAVEARHAAPSATTIKLLRDSVRAVLDRARADSAFPGAIGVVGNRESAFVTYGVGSLDWKPSPKPDENTLW